MAWRRPGDNHYLNHWWLVYRRIYMSFGPNELMSMFAITLISPTSLSNGKFLGRAIPIIVSVYYVWDLFQDWDTVLKKVLCFSRKSTIWSNLSGTKKTVTTLHHAIIFFNKMAGLVVGLVQINILMKMGKSNAPAFILKILCLRHKHNTHFSKQLFVSRHCKFIEADASVN